jgi:hypothetical protein
MSRVLHSRRTVSRRRVLAVTAAVGAGVSVAGVAGLSLAGEEDGAAAEAQALVVSLRDAGKGTFDVFAGDAKVSFTDRKLAAHLLKVVARG